MESIVPESIIGKSSMSNMNNNRFYDLSSDAASGKTYLHVPDGGALFGLGCRYSQYNSGQKFDTEQWGLSLDTSLESDNPISVFLYFKSVNKLVWNSSGVQILS